MSRASYHREYYARTAERRRKLSRERQETRRGLALLMDELGVLCSDVASGIFREFTRVFTMFVSSTMDTHRSMPHPPGYHSAYYRAHAKKISARSSRRQMCRRWCRWLLDELRAEGFLRATSAVLRKRATCKTPAFRFPRAPIWADKMAIKTIYQLARRVSQCLGIEFQVDHIVPLKGALVCGLHVETNLRVIPAHSNQKKWNRWPI